MGILVLNSVDLLEFGFGLVLDCVLTVHRHNEIILCKGDAIWVAVQHDGFVKLKK